MANRIQSIVLDGNKDEYECISYFRVVNGSGETMSLSQEEVIACIEDGYAFNIRIKTEEVPLEIGNTKDGRQYIKTDRDSDFPVSIVQNVPNT